MTFTLKPLEFLFVKNDVTGAVEIVSGKDHRTYTVRSGFSVVGEPPKLKSTIGARVLYCGHQGWFVADLIVIEGAVVVRPNGAISPEKLERTELDRVTHHVTDGPLPTFWRPDLGVFVVPASQCVVVSQ